MSTKILEDRVARVVLTGGPCAGKTSALPILRKACESIGARVFVIPEMATLLYSNGVRPQDAPGPKNLPFRLALMRGQLGHEEVWREMAALCSHPRKVILQDRGLFDELPYTSGESEFRNHLNALGLTVAQTFARYDLVIHLTSVAVDVPNLYAKMTNLARQENVAFEAAKADVDTWNAWKNHPNLHRIYNVGPSGHHISFEEKAAQVSHLIVEFLTRT